MRRIRIAHTMLCDRNAEQTFASERIQVSAIMCDGTAVKGAATPDVAIDPHDPADPQDIADYAQGETRVRTRVHQAQLRTCARAKYGHMAGYMPRGDLNLTLCDLRNLGRDRAFDGPRTAVTAEHTHRAGNTEGISGNARNLLRVHVVSIRTTLGRTYPQAAVAHIGNVGHTYTEPYGIDSSGRIYIYAIGVAHSNGVLVYSGDTPHRV